jgi:hypothetical protein
VFDQAMVDRVIATFAPAAWEAHYFQYQAQGWQVALAADCQQATYFDWYQHPRP